MEAPFANYGFDPTYGYDRERLLTVGAPEPPADFEQFWRDTHAEAQAVPPRASRRELAGTEKYRIFTVEFDALGGFRTGGFLTVPRGPVRRGFVVGHGYGGRAEPDIWLPADDAAAIFPCARGFNLSARSTLPASFETHVLHGIAQRETYIHRACVAELWAAARALTELVPEARTQLDYLGASFGGGIGALMLPWTDVFSRAFLSVPSFGNHPLRLTLPCTGSGELVRRYHAEHPDVTRVLAYYDAASAARFLKLPVLFECALFDPSVPPPGQFAVYNAAPESKQLVVRTVGHAAYPAEAAEAEVTVAAMRRFFDPKISTPIA